MRKLIYLAVLLLMSGCSALMPPPVRFPQLNERVIAGPGNYDLPKWSPDGKRIAFIDNDRKALTVYEIATQRTWTIGAEKFITIFDWGPQGDLSYLQYRPDLSGSPFPEVYDLHQVNVDGTNDRIVFGHIYSPRIFKWFSSGNKLIILASDPQSQDGQDDIYRVDLATGTTELLVTHSDLNMSEINAFSLSFDEAQLAISGLRNRDGTIINIVAIVSIGTHTANQEIEPHQAILDTYLRGGSISWVRSRRWIFGNGYASEGHCFNYSLLFLSVDNPSKSFCIPTVREAISAPDLSNDSAHITYVSPVGSGMDYVMLADLTPEYRSRLER